MRTVQGVLVCCLLASCGTQLESWQDEGHELTTTGQFLRTQDAVPGQYIVVLKGEAQEAHAAAMPELARALATRHGVAVERTYQHALRGFVIRGSEAQARALASHPEVAYVVEDGVVRASGTQTGATWGLDRIDQRNRLLDGSYTYDFTGYGVHAYIIDTGILASHSDFGGRASEDYTAITDGRGATDCHGHGTHVAGTVGGATWGVAKNVRLHAVRVLDCNGSGTFSGVIAGVDWVTGNHVKPAVANMSLGGGANQAVDDALSRSIAAGVTYVVAAGNSSSDACLFSPARTGEALTVGATDGSDNRAGFSNYGTCLDLFAPGVSITSAYHNGGTAVLSGTSMAAPHVAGAAALYLDLHPQASPAAVTQALLGGATPNVVGDTGAGSPNLLLYSRVAALPPISFAAPVQYYPSGWNFGNPSPWEPITGDFNGDRRTDYARLGGTYAHFFFSNGDGTFSNPTHVYPQGWDFGNPSPWKTITGDFNGDRRTDYARLGGTYSHFFLSNGDGTFSNPVHVYPQGWDFGYSDYWPVMTGDFNGDGRTDYARLGGTYAHFFFSNGDGTFSNPIHVYPQSWDFGNPSPWKTITGDFNGDRRTDYARLGGTYAHFFFSNGDGTFSNPTHVYPQGWDFGFSDYWPVMTGDFNGDGRTDYARLGGTYSHFFFSNGDGTFSNPVHYYPPGWNFGNPSPWETITGDFNGDGRTDYARLGGTYSLFFLSNGDGTFSNAIISYPDRWNFGFDATWPVITGDFDGNSKTDYARLGGTYSHLFLIR